MKTALNRHIKEEQKPSMVDVYLKEMKMDGEQYQKFCQTHGFTKKISKKSAKDFDQELRTLRDQKLSESLVSGKNKKIDLSRTPAKIKTISFLNQKLSKFDHPKDFILFLEDIADKINLNFLLKDYFTFGSLEVLYRIFENKNEWVDTSSLKKIKSKNSKRVLNHLIRHFFVKYKDFSHPCFFDYWHLSGKKYVFHMAYSKGESVVKSFRRSFSEELTKKEILGLSKYPSNLSYNEMVLNIYTKRYGGSEKLYRYLRFYRGDLNSKRFKDFINFMAKNEGFLDYSQVRPIWDFVDNQGIVSFKGRSLDNLLEGMSQWHRDLSKDVKVKFESWEGSKLSGYEEMTEDKGLVSMFKIEEVLNSVDLKREGKEMKHCVFSYISKCRGGSSSIWTLKQVNEINKQNLLTIEVSGENVYQVRGKCNRGAKDWEKKLIRKWADKEGLTYRQGGF